MGPIPNNTKWTAFTTTAFSIRSAKYSLFTNTKARLLYYIVIGRSLANPRYTYIVNLILRNFIKACATPNQIAVLCGYKAQLRVLRRLPAAVGVTLATIDSVQGREYPFVVLDLVTPGRNPLANRFRESGVCVDRGTRSDTRLSRLTAKFQ